MDSSFISKFARQITHTNPKIRSNNETIHASLA
jgi:hypothetical protein